MNYYIWTHKRFDVGYNGKQIVDVNLTKEVKHKLTPDAVIPFTYEVNWKPSATRFENRFDKYLDPNFFQHRVCLYCFCYLKPLFVWWFLFKYFVPVLQIHWFSIFNSFMMVIFLVGLVSMILMRTLRKDYARYSKDEEMDDMVKSLMKFAIFLWVAVSLNLENVLSIGTWLGRWVWMEASPWWCFQTTLSPIVLLCINWHWLPGNRCNHMCHCVCNFRWTLHRVSIFISN